MKRLVNRGIATCVATALVVVALGQWEALAQKMYWTDGVAGRIERANLDGSGRETLVAGLSWPRDIALDLRVTYDTWTSRSVDFPPHDPIHDCLRLTETTISTDLCGDSGPLFKFPLLAIPDVDLWIGQVPCGGQNLFFVGTSLDGELFPLGSKAIGASIIGLSQGTTLGLEGLENANCSTSTLSEGNPYAAALSTNSQAVQGLGGLLDDNSALAIGPAGTAQTVANKTYEIWFSGSLFPTLLQDCWHFTATTMTTDQCGDSGPLVEFPLFGVPGMSLWIGQVPCQGQNLVFFGTSYDGAVFPFGGNVVSATGFTLAAEGFENPACSSAR